MWLMTLSPRGSWIVGRTGALAAPYPSHVEWLPPLTRVVRVRFGEIPMTWCRRFRVRVFGAAVLVALASSALPASSAGHGRDVRESLSFYFQGTTVQRVVNALSFLQTDAGSGGWGDQLVQDHWRIKITVPLVIEIPTIDDATITGLVGRPAIDSIEGSGTSSVYPEAHCPFGKLCPKPGAPTYAAPCTTNFTINKPFFIDPGAPGYPNTSLLPAPTSTLQVGLRIPTNTNGLRISGKGCGKGPKRLAPTGLSIFVVPTQFGDAPRPYTDPRKLAEYTQAIAPVLKIKAEGSEDAPTTVRVVGKAYNDVNWSWTAKQAKKQIGQDVNESIDITSEFTDFKLTP